MDDFSNLKNAKMSVQDRLGLTNNNVQKVEIKKQVKEEKKEKKSFTKYEVSKESFFVIKFGLIQNEQRINVIPDSDVQFYSEAQHHWVKFRMWNYKEQLEWKENCMKFNQQSRSFLIDSNKLNEIKIKRLILDWSFGQIDTKFKLLHCGGVLSDESYQVILGFFPVIINNIINMMNGVLQGNE